MPNVNNANYQSATGNGWNVNTPLLTSGGTAQPALAAHANQLLLTHGMIPYYQGIGPTTINANPTNTLSFTGGTTGLWVAQRFQSNGSSIGYILTNFGLGTYPDGSLDPVSVQIWTDVAGKPGAPITPQSPKMTMTQEYLYATPLTLMVPVSIPSTSVVSGQFYWVVISGTRTSSGTENYFWQYQTTADVNQYYSTSTNSGSTWTNQTGGMYVQFFTSDVTGLLAWVALDGGGDNSPYMLFYRNGAIGSIASSYYEYWPGQISNNRTYVQTIRSISLSQNSFQTQVL